MLMVIIIRVDLIKSFRPNSFHKTIKVATHGNDLANNVAAINNCLTESPKGISIPTATSFLKKPITKATMDSLGKPNKPCRIGAKIAVIKSNNLK